jgi:hypothetical protein
MNNVLPFPRRRPRRRSLDPRQPDLFDVDLPRARTVLAIVLACGCDIQHIDAETLEIVFTTGALRLPQPLIDALTPAILDGDDGSDSSDTVPTSD